MTKINTYYLTFKNGHELIFIGTFYDMIGGLNELVQKYGECIECLLEVGYSKYTGTKTEKLW